MLEFLIGDSSFQSSLCSNSWSVKIPKWQRPTNSTSWKTLLFVSIQNPTLVSGQAWGWLPLVGIGKLTVKAEEAENGRSWKAEACLVTWDHSTVQVGLTAAPLKFWELWNVQQCPSYWDIWRFNVNHLKFWQIYRSVEDQSLCGWCQQEEEEREHPDVEADADADSWFWFVLWCWAKLRFLSFGRLASWRSTSDLLTTPTRNQFIRSPDLWFK